MQKGITSFKQNLKDPSAYAEILNYLRLETRIFSTAVTVVFHVIDGVLQLFFALTILQVHSVKEVEGVKSGSRVKAMQDYLLDRSLVEWQLVTQIGISGYFLLFVLLGWASVAAFKTSRSFAAQIVIYTTGSFLAAQNSFLKTIQMGVILEVFFIHQKQEVNVGTYITYSLSILNFLALLLLMFFLPKLTCNTLICSENAQTMPTTLQLAFNCICTLAITIGILSSDHQEDLRIKIPLWLVSIAIFLIFLTNSWLKVVRKAYLPLSEYLSLGLSTCIMSIMVISILYQESLLGQKESFSYLIVLCLLTSVAYSLAGFFYLYFSKDSHWRKLYQQKVLPEGQLEPILEMMIAKLNDVRLHGKKSVHLKDLILYVRYHQKYLCSQSECGCRQLARVVRKSFGLEDLQEEESDTLVVKNQEGNKGLLLALSYKFNAQKDKAETEELEKHALYYFLIQAMFEFAKNGHDLFPTNFDIILSTLNLCYLKKIEFKHFQAQAILIGIKQNRLGIFQKIHQKQLELIAHEQGSRLRWANFDPQALINLHNLELSLKDNIQNLSIFICEFWNLFNSDAFDLDKLTAQYDNVAQAIVSSQEDLRELELYGSHQTNVNYTWSLLQRLVFNDSQMADFYMKKIQSLRDMKRLFEKSKIAEADHLCFMIVSAYPQSFGRILVANSRLHLELDFESGVLNKNSNIEALMPKTLKSVHPTLVLKVSRL